MNFPLGGEMLRSIGHSWIWFGSGTTSESELYFCRATVEPNAFSSARQKHDVWTGSRTKSSDFLFFKKRNIFFAVSLYHGDTSRGESHFNLNVYTAFISFPEVLEIYSKADEKLYFFKINRCEDLIGFLQNFRTMYSANIVDTRSVLRIRC